MGRQVRYSPEVRERAVRMVFDQEAHHSSQWSAMQSIASKIGCTAETLRKWVRQAERDAGRRPGLTTEERQRLKELERESWEKGKLVRILGELRLDSHGEKDMRRFRLIRATSLSVSSAGRLSQVHDGHGVGVISVIWPARIRGEGALRVCVLGMLMLSVSALARDVSSLGRIEPHQGVFRLAGPKGNREVFLWLVTSRPDKLDS